MTDQTTKKTGTSTGDTTCSEPGAKGALNTTGGTGRGAVGETATQDAKNRMEGEGGRVEPRGGGLQSGPLTGPAGREDQMRPVDAHIDAAAENAYWRNAFPGRAYAKHGQSFEEYAPAYRAGWESAERERKSESFDVVEPTLAKTWDSVKGTSRLAWDQAKHAAREAWDRARLVVHGSKAHGAETHTPGSDKVGTHSVGTHRVGEHAAAVRPATLPTPQKETM